MKDQDQQT